MGLQNEGDYCCCNQNRESWKANDHQVIHVYSHSLKTAWKSYTRKIIASALDRGIRHPSCQACWDLEDAGIQSSRETFNKIFGDLEVIKTQPRVVIIKPGNTCNFACRMCNPVTSSSWYADGHELEKNNLGSSSWYSSDVDSNAANLSFNEYTKTFETVRSSFNRDNEEFWTTLKEWIPNLEYIDIYGGEPFLSPAMFDLLEYGVTSGVSKNVSLNLHTNASILNQSYAKILAQYNKVGFNLSIDSMNPEQFSHIRHKGDLDVTIKNSKKFLEFFQSYPNVDVGITLTVTPLNVFYVDQILEDLNREFNIPVGVNIVTTPEYDIRHLPIPVKNMLINTLSNPKIVNFLQQTIPGCDVEWPKFCRATDKLDQLRNQNFSKTFPEWWKLLEPYWVK